MTKLQWLLEERLYSTQKSDFKEFTEMKFELILLSKHEWSSILNIWNEIPNSSLIQHLKNQRKELKYLHPRIHLSTKINCYNLMPNKKRYEGNMQVWKKI